MRTTPQTLLLLKWLSALPPTVWWHLGETAVWVQPCAETSAKAIPPIPAGISLAIRFLDPSGNVERVT
jgi:hypothetical protein